MLNSVFFRNIGFAATLVALTAAGNARAQTDTATRVVSLHGLDLTSPADRAKLRRQILVAANAVCREVGHGDSYEDLQDCVQTTLNLAWPQAKAKIAQAESQAKLASSGK